MEKILNFLKKYGHLITIILLTLVWFKSCELKHECINNKKAIITLTNELSKRDSIIEHKLDSTIISNSAVVNSNNATSSAIQNQKQQQVVVKLLPNK